MEARTDLEIVPVTPPRRVPLAIWRQGACAREAKRRGADCLHSLTSAFPISRALPVVQTVHELPWLGGVAENAGWRHRRWIGLGRRFAAATCVPSPVTARHLEAREHPHVHVVPWGVGDEFTRESNEHDATLDDHARELPTEPFALVLGGERPKKRLDLVANGARVAGVPVVVTGEESPTLAEVLDTNAHVTHVGNVPESHLPALVRRASLVAVLSDSEGFAMPVLEALACGVPVVTPTGSVQSETAGGLAIDVDANDEHDVARGFDEALSRRDEVATAGPAFANERRWPDTAARLAELWRSIT